MRTGVHIEGKVVCFHSTKAYRWEQRSSSTVCSLVIGWLYLIFKNFFLKDVLNFIFKKDCSIVFSIP